MPQDAGGRVSLCPTCQVPSHTQFASPGLVEPIVYGGFDRAADPAWPESGAATLDDYARWCGHLCGLTCLRMALGPSAPTLFELRDGALKYGAYTEDPDGTIHGLIYAPFAEYVREVHGVNATVHRHLTVDEITGLLDEGRQVMVSVHYEIRRPHRQPPGAAATWCWSRDVPRTAACICTTPRASTRAHGRRTSPWASSSHSSPGAGCPCTDRRSPLLPGWRDDAWRQGRHRGWEHRRMRRRTRRAPRWRR